MVFMATGSPGSIEGKSAELSYHNLTTGHDEEKDKRNAVGYVSLILYAIRKVIILVYYSDACIPPVACVSNL